MFRQKNLHVVESGDISLGSYSYLKNQVEPYPCCTSFVKACLSTQQQ